MGKVWELVDEAGQSLDEAVGPWLVRAAAFAQKETLDAVDAALLDPANDPTRGARNNSSNSNFSSAVGDLTFPNSLRPEPVALKPFFQNLCEGLLAEPGLENLLDGSKKGSQQQQSQEDSDKGRLRSTLGALGGAIGGFFRK